MSKWSIILKTAGGVIATTATLLTTLRENPQAAEGIDKALSKVKAATDSEKPKLRFDAKLRAIEVAADAVEETFPMAVEPEGWRRQSKALRTRGELAWNGNTGKARRRAIKAVDGEASELLEGINRRLAEMQAEAAPSAIQPPTD
ncbi:MAG TPA: hypothetical protein K8V15_00865 [Tessaracoccus flavescens]|uniref:Uncharacterized protein n=1 Tax=Tessaracoccus flavescens TaxID=399497 RepID=A0A921EL33_9ACTN|nr:hypothetical protein [Tessaracoccus flavescens]